MLKGPPNSASPGDGGHSAAATDQDASAASSATSLPGPDTGVALLYLSSAGSLIIGTGAQFVAFLVLARYLGIHQFGLLTTIVAATNLAVPFCGLGSHEGIVRRLSRDPRDYSKMLGHALILIATTGTILSVVLAAILNCFVTISPNAGANLTSIAIIVVSNVVLHRFILLAEDIFISRWQMNKANGINIGLAIVKMLTVVIACIAFGVDRLETWAIWNGAAHLVLVAVCVVLIRPFGRPTWCFIFKEFWFGVHVTTPWACAALRQNIDVLVLGLVAPPGLVGAYALCKRIVESSLVTVKSLTRLVYPRLAVAQRESPRAILMLVTSYLKAMIALAVITALALFLFAPALPIAFGQDFAPAVPILKVLCWTLILTVVQWAAFDALGAGEQHRSRARVYNNGSLIGAALIGGLTYLGGVFGALSAIFIVEAFIALTLWIALLRFARVPGEHRPTAGHAGAGDAVGVSIRAQPKRAVSRT